MNAEILFSFIIPVFNAEKNLSTCLDSILNQSVKCFEIIIVNDGSTDDSQTIIDKYVSDNPLLIKAYQKKNGGPGDTRNFGIRNSTGSYIAFVDSDDCIEPNYASVIKTIINEHSPDMVIIGYNRIYNRQQSILERFHKFSEWNYFNRPIDIAVLPEILFKLEVASWLRIVKRELFLKDTATFFNQNSLAEDLEASLKWYLIADKIIVSSEKLYNYQIASNTLNFNTNNITQFIQIIESVCNYYKSKNKFHEYYAELECMFAKHILISNMLRLRAAQHDGKYVQFISLRTALLNYFPEYAKNKYLKSEPFYLRATIIMSYYFPKMFHLIL